VCSRVTFPHGPRRNSRIMHASKRVRCKKGRDAFFLGEEWPRAIGCYFGIPRDQPSATKVERFTALPFVTVA